MAKDKEEKNNTKKSEETSSDTKKKEEIPVTNTKTIPVIITLSAALIACVASILQHVEFEVYVKRLLFAVIVFGIIGIIVRVVLDRYFFRPKDEKEALEENKAKEEIEEDREEQGEDTEES